MGSPLYEQQPVSSTFLQSRKQYLCGTRMLSALLEVGEEGLDIEKMVSDGGCC